MSWQSTLSVALSFWSIPTGAGCTDVWSQIPDDWHHFAFVRNGGNLKLYRDGIMVSGVSSNIGVLENDAPMIAGTSICQETDGTMPLIGRIDA